MRFMQSRSPLPMLVLFCGIVLASRPSVIAATQPTVRISTARVEPAAGATARAYLVVENGTMYEVYLVAASSEAAAKVELMRTAADKSDSAPTPAAEIAVPAFDRLEMSPDSTFLQLTGLKQPLKSGESVTIVLTTDAGETLTAAATVQ